MLCNHNFSLCFSEYCLVGFDNCGTCYFPSQEDVGIDTYCRVFMFLVVISIGVVNRFQFWNSLLWYSVSLMRSDFMAISFSIYDWCCERSRPTAYWACLHPFSFKRALFGFYAGIAHVSIHFQVAMIFAIFMLKFFCKLSKLSPPGLFIFYFKDQKCQY